nr:hypothetical protein [Tanacetum cinerariifolium]
MEPGHDRVFGGSSFWWIDPSGGTQEGEMGWVGFRREKQLNTVEADLGTTSTSSNPTYYAQFIQRQCTITRLRSEFNAQLQRAASDAIKSRHHQGSQRLLDDILVSWDGYWLPETDDIPKSLHAAKPTEEVANQHETAAIKKADENVEEDPMATDVGIISFGNLNLDQIIEDAEFDPESMPKDEIMSISRDDEEEADSDNELSIADEVKANKVLHEILIEIKIEHSTALVFAAPINEVSSMSDQNSTFVFPMAGVQELDDKALLAKKNVPREKPINVQSLVARKRFKLIQFSSAPKLDSLGHLPRRMDFLVAHVHNLGQSMPTKFVDSMDSILPIMVVDPFEERLPELLSDTLKSQFPLLLTKLIRENLSGFNRITRNAMHDEIPKILKESFKSINKVTESQNKKNPKADENVEEDPMATDVGIISFGNLNLDQIIEDAEFDPESMPSDNELSIADEVKANKVLHEILIEIKIEHSTALVFAAPINEVSSMSDQNSTFVFPMAGVQELDDKALLAKKNVPREKPINVQSLVARKRFKLIQFSSAPKLDSLGHLPRRMDFLVAHVHNLGQSMPTKFVDSMDSILPIMVVDPFEERLPELLSDTLKSQFPLLLTKLIRENLSGFNRITRNAMHDEIPKILKESFKSINK